MPTWMDQYSDLRADDWENLMVSRGCKYRVEERSEDDAAEESFEGND